MYPLDHGEADRLLFLQDSMKYRAQKLARGVFRERTFWIVLLVCVLSLVGHILIHGGFEARQLVGAAMYPALAKLVSDREHVLIAAIVACHGGSCPLRLQELLDAEANDFAHDILGIRRHLDRETGKLQDCFLPRYFDHTRRQA